MPPSYCLPNASPFQKYTGIGKTKNKEWLYAGATRCQNVQAVDQRIAQSDRVLLSEKSEPVIC